MNTNAIFKFRLRIMPTTHAVVKLFFTDRFLPVAECLGLRTQIYFLSSSDCFFPVYPWWSAFPTQFGAQVFGAGCGQRCCFPWQSTLPHESFGSTHHLSTEGASNHSHQSLAQVTLSKSQSDFFAKDALICWTLPVIVCIRLLAPLRQEGMERPPGDLVVPTQVAFNPLAVCIGCVYSAAATQQST